MGSSVWHTDLYVYPTFKNVLNCDYCHLCFSVCRRGAVTMPRLSQNRIKASAYQLAHGTSLPSQNHRYFRLCNQDWKLDHVCKQSLLRSVHVNGLTGCTNLLQYTQVGYKMNNISTKYTNVFTGWKFQYFGPFFLSLSLHKNTQSRIIKSLR